MKLLIIFSLVLFAVADYAWPAEGGVIDPSSDGDQTDFSDYSPKYQYPSSDESDTLGACWMQTYVRLGQQPLNPCTDGLVLIESFCYEPCKDGYQQGFFSGLGDEADENPSSSEDTSDVDSYCWSPCPEDYTDGGTGELCYSKANEDKTIQRTSYNRTTYVDTLECPPSHDLMNGLCYPPVKKGFRCTGTLCFGECPHGWGQCGALCTKPGLCKGNLYNEGTDVWLSLLSDASDVTDSADEDLVLPTKVPHVSDGPNYPFCH